MSVRRERVKQEEFEGLGRRRRGAFKNTSFDEKGSSQGGGNDDRLATDRRISIHLMAQTRVVGLS